TREQVATFVGLLELLEDALVGVVVDAGVEQRRGDRVTGMILEDPQAPEGGAQPVGKVRVLGEPEVDALRGVRALHTQLLGWTDRGQPSETAWPVRSRLERVGSFCQATQGPTALKSGHECARRHG